MREITRSVKVALKCLIAVVLVDVDLSYWTSKVEHLVAFAAIVSNICTAHAQKQFLCTSGVNLDTAVRFADSHHSLSLLTAGWLEPGRPPSLLLLLLYLGRMHDTGVRVSPGLKSTYDGLATCAPSHTRPSSKATVAYVVCRGEG